MFAKDALDEIEQWRKTNATHYQLDWRWVERYRTLCAYDMYWWWAQAGPFTEEEQQHWDKLFTPNLDEATKQQLGMLIAQSRTRELRAAIAEQREPHLHYPTLAIDEVRSRIVKFQHLDTEISQQEQNAIVRRLYHDAIDEAVQNLRLIEATYEKNNVRFWELIRLLIPEPTFEEMDYALSRVRHMLIRGLARPETVEVSQRLIKFFRERLQRPLDLSSNEQAVQEPQPSGPSSPSRSQQMVSPQTARRFFETILHEHGYEGWQVIIDPNAHGARVEQGLRQLFLMDAPLSVDRIRHYISHELAGHAGRCIAGEHSKLGLLGVHTRNSLETEEGLAMYYDRLAETPPSGQAYESTTTWSGALATGLASGVMTPPQTFLSLYTFFEAFYLLFQLLRLPTADMQKAQEQASQSALSMCLRTYLGVSDLEQAGVCLTKDVLYLRGLRKIEQAIMEHGEAVLDRLALGVVALEQLPDLQELGIVTSFQSLRHLVNDPDLESYIFSFAQREEKQSI